MFLVGGTGNLEAEPDYQALQQRSVSCKKPLQVLTDPERACLLKTLWKQAGEMGIRTEALGSVSVLT